MYLTDLPCCVCVKNVEFAKVYFVLALVFEVEETRAEHNVANGRVQLLALTLERHYGREVKEKAKRKKI